MLWQGKTENQFKRGSFYSTGVTQAELREERKERGEVFCSCRVTQGKLATPGN